MNQYDELKVEYDKVTKDYFVIWQPPLAVASGKTKVEALQDLQQVVYFCIDSCMEVDTERK